QEVAQCCATSCALVYSSRFMSAVAMYPHGYPHLSAQLLAHHGYMLLFATTSLYLTPDVSIADTKESPFTGSPFRFSGL
ncbi:hypothetical protein, partial [Pseudomonas sp. TWR3-1-1]|uniref:hypothetical protein n=1 Tax=Pseudomonas sp. TWR3-1-1 TaxID=2804633 RepID=UPI003CF1EF76